MRFSTISAAAMATAILASHNGASAYEIEENVRFDDKVIAFTAPTPAPLTPIDMLDGRETTLKAYRGRVVVVTMWATWCEVCAVEMPMLAPLAWSLPAKGVDILPVSVDIDRDGRKAMDIVLEYLTSPSVSGLPALVDRDHGMAAAVGLRGTPTTLIVDKFGNVAAAFEGQAPLDDPAFHAYLEDLAASATPEASLAILGERE